MIKLFISTVSTFIHNNAYMQISYCVTQAARTQLLLQQKSLYRSSVGSDYLQSAKRKLANRKWVHIYGSSVLVFCLICQVWERMKVVLNKRERDGDWLLFMMMTNDDISKTDEDNVKINDTWVNNNTVMPTLISSSLLSLIAHNSSSSVCKFELCIWNPCILGQAPYFIQEK